MAWDWIGCLVCVVCFVPMLHIHTYMIIYEWMYDVRVYVYVKVGLHQKSPLESCQPHHRFQPCRRQRPSLWPPMLPACCDKICGLMIHRESHALLECQHQKAWNLKIFDTKALHGAPQQICFRMVFRSSKSWQDILCVAILRRLTSSL